MTVSTDLESVVAASFGVGKDLIHIMNENGEEISLTSVGNPMGKMAEDYYKTDSEADPGVLVHTRGTVSVEINDAHFIAVIRRISRHGKVGGASVEHHLLALYVREDILDAEDAVLESLAQALEGVDCASDA